MMLKLYPMLILAASSLLGCIAINLLDDEYPVYTCDGVEYAPPYQICENGIVKIKCGNDYYNPTGQFCSEQDNRIYDKCEGRNYNTENQMCENARIYDKCGNSKMNSAIEGCCNNIIFALATQFCYGIVYDRCGGKEYNPLAEICENSIVKKTCGEGVSYDPATQFCKGNVIYKKCGGVEYDPLEQICENNTVLLKCGEKLYDPSLAHCDNNIVKDKETFIDDRDSITYKYVIIGAQVWMAENLRYETSSFKCYDNNPDNCKIFGILYNWNMAKTVCPQGWHLPNDEEWNELGNNAGVKLKANSELWSSGKGTDDFGFTALPGGFHRNSFEQIGITAGFWSATAGLATGSAHFRYLSHVNDMLNLAGFYTDTGWANVRCLKND
jgi:uncharacterized protein (TIGR02145 family)